MYKYVYIVPLPKYSGEINIDGNITADVIDLLHQKSQEIKL